MELIALDGCLECRVQKLVVELQHAVLKTAGCRSDFPIPFEEEAFDCVAASRQLEAERDLDAVHDHDRVPQAIESRSRRHGLRENGRNQQRSGEEQPDSQAHEGLVGAHVRSSTSPGIVAQAQLRRFHMAAQPLDPHIVVAVL